MKRNDTVKDNYEHIARSAEKAFECCVNAGVTGSYLLRKMLKKAMANINEIYKKALSQKEDSLSLSYGWIYDNYYLYEEKYLYLRSAIKKKSSFTACTFCDDGGIPKVLPLYFAAFYSSFSESCCEVDKAFISAFVSGMEKSTHRPDYSDFQSFGLLWNAALFVLLGKCCEKVMENGDSADDAERIGRITASLRYLSDFSVDEYYDKCPAEELLRSDPAGAYCFMSEQTKNYYRQRVAELSKKKGISEEEFAGRILRKARNGENIREKHIGFFLYPAKKRHIGVLYFLLLSSLTLASTVVLTAMQPLSAVVLLPIYELTKQICDRSFSFFVETVPLPRLELEIVPDTDAVVTVITSVLTEEMLDDMFVRLENMYHSSGGANIYFALLCDYPESERPEEPSDEHLFEKAKDRIQALNIKYGKSFFLFVRKREYCASRRKFMGYERKRGAVGEFCRYLSGEKCGSFIANPCMPDGDVCNKIRFVLTLDSDTNMPPDAVKELAGIMLHPLNRCVIDSQKGIVTHGYALLQPGASTELSSAGKTAFARLFSGCGGFDIYSFSGFELYQSVFGEGTFCGKGMFDKNAFMKCVEAESFSFPENTVLSHDILEGARLKTANVTDISFTDSFPKNIVSYLKRHHRWVRGDTQNLIFLRKYIRNKNGKPIRNNISPLSKYKLFDNFRRAIVPVFAYLGVVISCFLPKPSGSLVLLASLAYILYAFVSDFLVKLISVGIGCTARKYFSKNAIPGVILSFYRMLVEISMLPSMAATSFSAVCTSLYRMLVSGRNMLEWTTASSADMLSDDSVLYYINKNLFCAVSGAVLFVFAVSSPVKLVGLMWFVFPITAYFLGKKGKDKAAKPDAEQKQRIKRYVKDIWKYFCDAATEKSRFLPIDNIQLYPYEIRSDKTSPTNIGLYLVSILAARDFEIIDSHKLYDMLYKTLDSVEHLKKWHGHLYNWYETSSGKVIQPEVVSSVDSGNFLACLICLKEGLREYVHEKTELLDIISITEHIIDNTDIKSLYDSGKKLFYIDVTPDENGKACYSRNHFDMLMSEARTLSYIAIAKKAADIKHFRRLSRPAIKKGSRVGVASWTGTAFEYFMPALFMPSVKGSLMYEALRFAMYCGKRRCAATPSGAVFGISESGYHSFDGELRYQYKAFGVPELGIKSGLEKELVISPYSSFLMLCLDIKTALVNLEKLEKEGVYCQYGFCEAYDFSSDKSGKPHIVKSCMSHHAGMSIIASANAVLDNVFVKRFMRDAEMRSVYELLEERIPVDAVVKKTKASGYVPDKENTLR